jgi:uncharacterized membrane protein YkvA (DUF1232 family)
MPPRQTSKDAPMFGAKEVRAYIREKAAQMAPADVQAVVAEAEEIRRRAAAEREHPVLARQAELALRLLSGHHSGESPQIPYFTVSLMCVALLYFLDQTDVIPDWLPRVGTSDDALVFQLAFEMGAAGVRRYCDAHDLSTEGLLPKPPLRRKPS